MTTRTPQTWHPVWESIFSQRSSWGKYPPEELIRFVAANYYKAEPRSAIRVLEIGCGPGAGPSWYVAREGFSLSGIDGSPTAIDKANARFSKNGLTGEFKVGDLATLPWPDAAFDAVIDVACLQHNSEADTETILREVHRVLKPGGRHFSLTARQGCWGDGSGPRVDSTSYTDLAEGPFASMGVIRFATAESLARHYRQFRELNLEYSARSMQGGSVEISNWIVTCAK
jgi:ubiquinone/menaquinone biosynthesis C-methylase UbiE